MDNSTGTYQIWTVPIDFSSLEGFEENESLPGKSGLVQNYPNPFSSATKIGYRVLSTGFVSLKVFDVFGIQVAELVKEIKSPGYYEALFNSDNLLAQPQLRSGIFFYRLTVNDRVETGRMLYF